MSQVLAPGDTVKINSSLIIQNVTLRDLDNYSCVAINRGGMAECRTNLTLVQVRLNLPVSQCVEMAVSGELLVRAYRGDHHHPNNTGGRHCCCLQSPHPQDTGHKVRPGDI